MEYGWNWMIKHICFNWPFHNLFEFCGFTMTDILKIKKFNIVIKVEDEVLQSISDRYKDNEGRTYVE